MASVISVGLCALLPGYTSRSYAANEPLPLLAKALESARTQLPYDYYHLPSCHGSIVHAPETLGEVLHGDELVSVPFEFRMRASEFRALCRVEFDPDEQLTFARFVRDDYRAQLLLDNLPVATRLGGDFGCGGGDCGVSARFQLGYRLGTVAENAGKRAPVTVFNHLDFTVRYHPLPQTAASEPPRARIVGFEVTPSSRRYRYKDSKWPRDYMGADGSAKDPLNIEPSSVELERLPGSATFVPGGLRSLKIVYTYNVTYVESNVPYSSRWDVYLNLGGESARVHWLSLSGSLVVSLLLASLVGAIIIRTLRRDLQMYNALDLELDDDVDNDIGWKYCHADVFRPPERPILLATAVGTAVQLGCVVLTTLLLSLAGFIRPSARGSLLNVALALFVAAAMPAGYVAARLYRQMLGCQPYTLLASLALLFPSGVMAIFFVLDVALWWQGASSAVPFSTLVVLLLLWLCIDGPLAALGVLLGSRAPRSDDPVFTNQIPRQVPYQPSLHGTWPVALAGGLLPFAAGSVELGLLVSSVWTHTIYAVFGFLLLVTLLMAIVCAEVSIIFCYRQLCRENHRWWWRSFACTSTTGVYFFAYAAWYARSELHLSGLTALLIYHGYMALAALSLGLMAGAMGFGASFYFVRTIYAAVKVD